MPRPPRVAPGGYVFHALNRANGRLTLFRAARDFQAFYDVLFQAMRYHPIRLLGWCLMGNHWHFVAWPRADGQLSRFFGYLSLTHAARWQVAHRAVGTGHVYQARFKSFMIERDEPLLWVLRYVERNALRAGLVRRAQDWPWSSLHARLHGPAELRALLSDWPVERPRDWLAQVNRPQTPAEQEAIARAIRRGRPLGGDDWVARVVRSHGLQSTLRPRGRQPGWKKGE